MFGKYFHISLSQNFGNSFSVKIIFSLIIPLLLLGSDTYSQQSEFNRPQITLLIEHQKSLGDDAENFSIFMSFPKINCPYLTIAGTDYLFIPKEWPIERDFFRYKDEYDEQNYTQLPYFNKVDYNSIKSQLFTYSMDDAAQKPNEYLLSQSAEIFEYIFAKSNNTFSIERIVKRSVYNARDAALRLSENVQRGDAIIKDDLDRIFNNIFIVGLKILSYKVDKHQSKFVKCNVYLMKVDYSKIINSSNFWTNCFKSQITTPCYDKNDIKINFIKKSSISAAWSEAEKYNQTMHSGFYQLIQGIFTSFN